jgi:periplasmic divalent cation tolerance protein
MYNYENKITEEPEVVLVIKTREGKYSQIEAVIKNEINYDNFIGEINVTQVNTNFESWLCRVVT